MNIIRAISVAMSVAMSVVKNNSYISIATNNNYKNDCLAMNNNYTCSH